MQTKICSLCTGVFPATTEYFNSHKGHSDGLNSKCKDCSSRAAREYNKARAFEPQYDVNKMKRCSSCKSELPATPENFSRNRRNPDGLRGVCKVCISEGTKRYLENNPDKVKLAKTVWHIKFSDKINRQSTEWRRANWGKIKSRYAEYQARRRDLIEKAGGGYTEEDVERQRIAQDGTCYWCGMTLDETCETDHLIPVSRGGSNEPSNIVISCGPCNARKGDKTPDEFVAWLELRDEVLNGGAR